MLMIGHFIGRDTKLLELSKQEGEKILEFKCTVHFLGAILQ